MLVWLSLAASLAVYAGEGMFAQRRRGWFGPRAIGHVNKAVGVIFVLTAVGYYLDRYSLLFSSSGVAFGAGYTDVHARLPALYVMTAVSLAVAVLFFSARVPVQPRRLVTGVAIWFGCAILFQGVYPAFLQWYRVTPNQLDLESPYIANAINGTLKAYDLDSVQQVPYQVAPGPHLRRAGAGPARPLTTCASGTGVRCCTPTARSRSCAPTTTSAAWTWTATRCSAA